MPRFAVIDFETTGASIGQGARATEVAIVLLDGGRIVDRFQSLMNGGVWVPPFITQLTGISNAMVQAAPPADAVMRDAARFVGDVPLVAHNAAFDRAFWQAELTRADVPTSPELHPFACTVRLSRRLYPHLPRHRLGALAEHHGITFSGRAHRAGADAEVTAEVLLRMLAEVQRRFGCDAPDHALLCALQTFPTQQLDKRMAAWLGRKTRTTASATTATPA